MRNLILLLLAVMLLAASGAVADALPVRDFGEAADRFAANPRNVKDIGDPFVLCEDGTATLPRHARVEVCNANSKSCGMTSDGLGFFAEAYDAEFQAWADACNADSYCPAAASAWDGYCAAVTTDSCLKAQKSGAIEEVPLTERPDFYKD